MSCNDPKTAAICISLGLLGMLAYRHTLLQSQLKHTQSSMLSLKMQVAKSNQQCEELYYAAQELQAETQQKSRRHLTSHRVDIGNNDRTPEHPPEFLEQQPSFVNTVTGDDSPYPQEEPLDPKTKERIARVVAANTKVKNEEQYN